jgi:uncharacterized Fe-S cluster protein YjdI
MTKEYSNGEVTIIWKPEKCFQSCICARTLPQVYHPTLHPWITPENATAEEIIKQVNTCPSGALTYRLDVPEAKASSRTDKL